MIKWINTEVNRYKENIKDFIKKPNLGILRFSWRTTLLYLVIFINIMLSTFIYLYTKDFSVGKRVITNGDKVIVFQGMMHRAMPEFYDVVFGDLKRYQDKGYVFYREGVSNGKIKENNLKFAGFMKNLKSCNTSFSKSMMEMVSQKDYEHFIYANEFSKGKLVDLNLDQLSQFVVKDYLGMDIDPDANKVCMQFTRPLFNFAMNVNDISVKPDFFEDVILKPRDMHLAMTLMASNDKNIYVQYGDAHWEGVWEILKDNNYKLVSEEELYPLK